MSYNKIFIVFFLLTLQQLAWSQEEDILPVSDVEVVKAFEAKLQEAKKVGTSPVLPDTDIAAPKYNYDITIVPLEIAYPDPEIRPLALKSPELKDPKMFWLKAGYGNLKRPNVNLGYNLYIEDVYNASIWAAYEGGDEIRKYENLAFNANGSFKLSNALELLGGFGYLRDVRDLNSIDSITESSLLNRKLNAIGFNAGIKNNGLVLDRLEYGASVDINRVSTNYQEEKASETILKVPVYLNVHTSDQTMLHFTNTFENSSSDLYENNFSNQLKSFFKANGASFSIKVGASLLKTNDDLFIFPIGKATYSFSQIPIRLYAGADQEYYRNNLLGVFNLSPYYSKNSVLNNLTITNSIFAGTEGSIYKNKLKYNFQGGYKILTNLQDFNFIENDADVLDVKFTDGNAIFLNGYAELKLSDWLSTGLNFNQHFYDLEDDFGLPNTEIESFLKLHSKNKWHVKPIISYRSKATTQVVNLSGNLRNEELNQLIDLSIEADYFFHKNFGIYLELNNLFNQRYERWYTYPDYKFNVYGGIKLKF